MSLKNREGNKYNQEISYKKYLNDLSGIAPISSKDQLELVKLCKQGDKVAETKLVQANLKFVISIAKQYPNSFLSVTDLINEGNMGLLKAIEYYDENNKVNFITYAVYWVRRYIIAAIQEYTSVVRLPIQVRNSIRKHEKIIERVQNTNTIIPSNEDLMKELDVTEDALKILQEIQRYADSLDYRAEEGGEEGYNLLTVDVFPNPDTTPMKESLNIDLLRTFTKLNESEVKVLKLYFGLQGQEPLFPDDVGKALGITSERARQIKENALKKLRKFEILKQYEY